MFQIDFTLLQWGCGAAQPAPQHSFPPGARLRRAPGGSRRFLARLRPPNHPFQTASEQSRESERNISSYANVSSADNKPLLNGVDAQAGWTRSDGLAGHN